MTVEIEGQIYYSTEEACKYLSVTRDTLNRMSKDGRLHKYHQGFSKKIYYLQTELDQLKKMRVEESGNEK